MTVRKVRTHQIEANVLDKFIELSKRKDISRSSYIELLICRELLDAGKLDVKDVPTPNKHFENLKAEYEERAKKDFVDSIPSFEDRLGLITAF